jgi:hypothetical protein
MDDKFRSPKARLCAREGCDSLLPARSGRGRPRLRCDNCAAARRRELDAARKRGRPERELRPRTTEPGDAGTPEWCAFSGFAPADLERHLIEPYSATDAEEIKALYPDYEHKGVITRVVRQSGGLKMPKFPLPGHRPIPVQLDPDDEVITDPTVKWLKHDRVLPEGRKVLALVRRGDKLKLIPSHWVKRRERVYGYEISMELALEHIKRSRSDDSYDRETGEGDHRGVNVEGWHPHKPRTAKYVNFGPNKRIDVGPDALDLWLTAPMALLIIEGKKKHMAAEAHGWATASVLSITMWDRNEVRWLARWIRKHNPDLILFVIPDGDWTNFDRNHGAVFRQTMYVLTELRELDVRALMLTTPVPEGTSECRCKVKDLLARNLPFERVSEAKTCSYCFGYLKAFDDWYGADGATEDLVVFDREVPTGRINLHVFGLPIHGNAKPGRARALRGLSLHDRDGCDLLDVPLKTLQQIMGARRPQDVPVILEDLSDALEIDGKLEIEKRPYVREDFSVGEAWDWVERPRIRVKPEFRAGERSLTLGEFRNDLENPATMERASALIPGARPPSKAVPPTSGERERGESANQSERSEAAAS